MAHLISGLVVRTSYLPWPPNIVEERNAEDDSIKNLWGYEISLLETIADKIGIVIRYHKPEDNEWGNIKKNESESYWSGMIGELAYNRADLSISAITIQQPRSRVSTPAAGYGRDNIQIFAPGPSPLPSFYALIRSFDILSWAVILGLTILFPLITHALLYPVSRFSLQSTILYTVSVFFKESFLTEFYDLKGFQKYKKSMLGVYLLLGSWLLSTTILTMSYTCNLKAHMITPGYSKPLENLEETVASNYPIKMYGIGAGIENEWKTSTNPEIKQFYSKREVLKFSPNFEVLDEVGNGSTIFVDWFSTKAIVDIRFPDTGNKKLITLVDTGTKMSPKYIMAFHMRKRFRGKGVMSRMVSRLLEGGLVEKMYQDTIARMFKELGEEEKKTIMKRRVERGLKPWSMSELQPAFLCLAFLIIVSSLVFLLEILLG